MNRGGPTTAAAYGQACVQCFKAKCKCERRPGFSTCERCLRLHKTCTPSTPARKRKTQHGQNAAATARISHLEDKVENLVSLLQSMVESTESSPALRQALDSATQSLQDGQTSSSGASIIATTAAPVKSLTAGSANPCCSSDIRSDGTLEALSGSSERIASTSVSQDAGVLPDDAEVYLEYFRNHMLPFFPFTYLSPEITAQQLCHESPFLYRAITAVASAKVELRLERGHQLKRVLAEATLVENQSSMDLLLGLLTYVAWGYDQLLKKEDTVSRLTQLAMSIVYALRLNKPVPDDAHGAVSDSEYGGGSNDDDETLEQSSLNKPRAVMGCFVISSFVSHYFGQIDAMQWTPQMEKFLNTIATSKAYQSDDVLVYQVKLQMLSQKTTLLREHREFERLAAPSTLPDLFPAYSYLKTIQGQLENLRKDLPRLSEVNPVEQTLMAYTHFVDLGIYETAQNLNGSAPLLRPEVGSGSLGSELGFERVQWFWKSLDQINSWLDIYFALPFSSYMGVSLLYVGQISRCLGVLLRLSTYEDPAWDREAVRGKVDIVEILGRLIDHLERSGHGTPEEGIFAHYSSKLRMFRGWICPRLVPGDASGGGGDWVPNPDGDNGVNIDEFGIDFNQLMAQYVDFGNDSWMDDSYGRL
ncbi:hypothetical protein BX600DRAFT_440281 [Xylariales sp. PMI_506]|nr:hypothetical protein BX600DRAFT_440281 [Xylariales sp. PMI_506]